MSVRSIDLKNGAITLLVIACIFAAGALVGKYYFSKTDIKVIDRIVYTTVYKESAPTQYTPENFDKLLLWANSPINFKDRTEKNYLFVTAFDLNKENTARYEIGTKGNWKVYGVIAGLAAIAGGIAVYELKR